MVVVRIHAALSGGLELIHLNVLENGRSVVASIYATEFLSTDFTVMPWQWESD